jgi:hypothetical protein
MTVVAENGAVAIYRQRLALRLNSVALVLACTPFGSPYSAAVSRKTPGSIRK